MSQSWFTVLSVILFLFRIIYADKPCYARDIPGKSKVCVCTSEYCDDVTRDEPTNGRYIAYTTSKGGMRFSKTFGLMERFYTPGSPSTVILKLDPELQYQTIEGFGGAVTDAAAMNWKSLPSAAQQHLIDSYFSEDGIEYSMSRVPIGGSDFSTHPYAYNEFPKYDTKLSNYSLTYEDLDFKIPMYRAIMKASKSPVHIVASTWSPPNWMKTNKNVTGRSRLHEEYFQTYADYHLRFIQKYDEQGIPIWAVTTTNEPLDGVMPIVRFNTLGWSADKLAEWISDNLGPTLRNSKYKHVKILAVDDQQFLIPLWFDMVVTVKPEALQYIDGAAIHFYADQFSAVEMLTKFTKKYPDKFILYTEACEGSFPWQKEKVSLGSWSRAERYIRNVIDVLNHDSVGWIDWNLCLDEKGGPNWVENYVDAPIIISASKGEFIKQPMFYVIGHISKFVPRGSRRIKVTMKSDYMETIDNVAFLTPRDTIVVIMYNSKTVKTVKVKLNNKQAVVRLDPDSITTIEFAYEVCECAKH